MNYSGVIYAVIVIAWAAVLVPRWVRRNEDVERAREVDEHRGVRVIARGAVSALRPRHLLRRGLGRRRANASPVVVRQPVQATPEQDHAARLAFQGAARRRRRVLLGLVVATVAGGVAVAIAAVPPVWVGLPGGSLLVFMVLARRAAASEAARLEAPVLAEDQIVAVPGVESAWESADEVPEGARVAVLDGEVAEPVDPNAWSPVPVPLPTYVTKARADRVVRRSIDLTGDGAWTSARLDPAASVELPPRPGTPERRAMWAGSEMVLDERADAAAAGWDVDDADAEVSDEGPERRRAVGD